MVPPPTPHSRRLHAARHLRSSALIIVLFFVSLLSILLIGFLASMRLERISAHSHLGGVTADIYADAGVSVAVSQLYGAISNPTNFYVSHPGLIITYNPGTGLPQSTNNLSSGLEANPAGGVPVNEGVDLNPIAVQGAGYLIAQTNSTLPVSSLCVRWIYQHADGTFDPNNPPSASSTPVIGRFAYWVDDEATKMNLNTGWDRNATTATNASNPDRVSLDVLSTNASGSLNPTNVYNYATFTNHFNSVEEMGRANVPTDTLQQKFSTTFYSHSPSISMIGQPRILLTTQKWLADANGTTNFIDILNTESTAPFGKSGFVDPGLLANMNSSKTTAMLEKISGELSATNWPFAPGKSFTSKYVNSTDVEQIALNIVDYVRSVESTNTLIEPVRIYTQKGTTNFGAYAYPPAADPTSIGAPTALKFSYGRRLYITEMGVSFPTASVKNSGVNATTNTAVPANAYYITTPYFVKIYLPYFPGNQTVDLTQYHLVEQTMTNSSPSTMSQPTLTNSISTGTSSTISGDSLTGQKTLSPGHTVTITRNGYWWEPKAGASYPNWAPKAPTMDIKFYILNNSTTLRQEVAEDTGYAVTTLGQSNSVCVDDPMVNQYPAPNGDWIPSSSPGYANDGLTRPTTSVVGHTSSTTPEQDADGSGNITTNFMQVPAPNGDTGNPSGIVQSVGELGLVHTGNDASGTGGTTPGVPWRTLHLQPQKNTTFLPDWAVLDLFSAPVYTNMISTTSMPYVMPFNTNTTSPTSISIPSRGGRININATTYGFSADNNAFIATNRVLPLSALLNEAQSSTPTSHPPYPILYSSGSGGLSTASATNLATHILNYTTASTGTNYDAGKAYTNYYSPGQLAEIKGIADGGEGTEAVVRETSSLAAVNSNVFSIYAVGQALQVDKLGGIHVIGEQRKQVMIERVVLPGSPPTVQFQPVYSRNL